MEEIKTHSPCDSVTSQQTRQSTASDRLTPLSPNIKLGGQGERRASSDTAVSEKSARTEHGSISEYDSHGGPHLSKLYGWPHLAQKMKEVPEFAAFPRFRELNFKNLLYYQTELELLHQQIKKAELEESKKEEEEEGSYIRRYDTIVEDGDTEYHRLLLKLRVILREYNNALLQLSKVSALADPEEYNMCSLRGWISDPVGGAGQIQDRHGLVETYGGKFDIEHSSSFREVLSALLWAKPPPKGDFDLVVTHPETRIDGLTKWTVYYLFPLWLSFKHRYRSKFDDEERNVGAGHKEQVTVLDTVERISEGAALRLTSSFSTIVACLIPIIAIVVLKQLSRTRDLLLCITGFAIIFAAGLIFLTRGTSSRTEIFAATAAFSAVMVVFISQPVIQVAPGSEVSVHG